MLRAPPQRMENHERVDLWEAEGEDDEGHSPDGEDADEEDED